VSSTAKNLVEKMLHVDPKQRYRAIDVLRHPFITERLSLPTRILHHERDSRRVKEDVGRIFDALNAPPSLNLNPVVQSSLAKRRANRSTSKTMITV
jgi:p90 ribosomal S6 kinase